MSEAVSSRKGIAILVAMAISASLAIAARPTERLVDSRPKIDLETMIPKAFGDWKIDPNIVPIQVSPEVQAKLDELYNQILARTYVNSKGERVMLSIAYGGTQTKAMQVHKPEVCYPAQGFTIRNVQKSALRTSFGTLPVMHIVASQGPRIEPITYWIMMDNIPVRGAIEQNLARLRFGLEGVIPDGLLVRVSSISADSNVAYELHRTFIDALLRSLSPDQRGRLIGRPLT